MCQSAFAQALQSRLGQTAEVLRQTDNRDRYGAVSADKNTVAHRYRCRLMRDGTPDRPVVIGDKSVVRSDWRILLPLLSDVQSDDVIRIEGQLFEVLDTDKGRAGASFLTVFARHTT